MIRPELVDNIAGPFRVWDYPVVGRDYVAGADVAEGRKRDIMNGRLRRTGVPSGDRPDYSAVVVIELESGLHVATWHGYLTPDRFAEVVAAIGFYYNSALLVPELNGPGAAVVSHLMERIKYPNIYRSQMFNVLDMDPMQPKLGFQTNEVSRQQLIGQIHATLNDGRLWTRDRKLAAELRTMEFDDQGKPRGRGRNKDDLVFAYGLAAIGRYHTIGLLPHQRKVEAVPVERQFDKMVWDRVKQQKEQHERRSRSLGGLYAPWSRGSWVGRS